ncbi:MAG: long-chain fatty acid--CoA ligase [Anaerolineae bacterium]|nr:long-chain fatty acid--CoA ligase [Anaerolineae bacterium]MCX8066769.1 long-chain fatty acid--CoA ligase [Anaerolineae bacterium]
MEIQRPWLKRYDPGVPHHIDYPIVPLYHFLEDAARRFPDHLAIIFKGGKLTYRQLNELTDRMAAALAKMGVKKGDRVAILMANCPQFIISYFGVLKAGGIVVACNPLYAPPELEHQLNDCGAEVMIVMSRYYPVVKQVQPKTKVRHVIVTNIKEYFPPHLRLLFTLAMEKKSGDRVDLAPGDRWFQDVLKAHSPAERPRVEINPKEDVAIFQYTGGTTGIPKGAMATHFNLVANSLQIKSWLPGVKDAELTVLTALPLFHVYGMVAAMCFSIAAVATQILIPNPRDINDILETINKYKPSIFPGVPTMYNAINNHPKVLEGKVNIRSIRACISGSAPLLRETQTRFEQLTGGNLREGYGLSEAPTATHCNPMLGENREGSIGLPLPDVDAAIVDLDTGTRFLGPGEEGELIIRGPQVFKGYWQMPTETANVLRQMPDGNVWLFTGDIAKMDEDGYFYIVDRKKDMIICGGYNVYPREVEEVLKQHPKILEVAVAGIPDPYRGETVKAWVVLKPGETATEEEIIEWSKERLAKYKYPRYVEFRTELPKTYVGKTLRRMLVAEERAKMAGQTPPPPPEGE